jgi:hypothetical protein
LLKSVSKIRSFFRERDQEDLIDEKTMLLHASAFGLYLLSVLVFSGCSILYFLEHISVEDYEKGTLFYIWVSFIALLLLALIFWSQGHKLEVTRGTEGPEVYVETENDDDLMNARIWNQFQRATREEENNYLL